MDLLRNAAMAVGILFCIGLIGAQFVGGGADDGAEVDAAEQQAAMSRISPVASVAVTGSAPAAAEAAAATAAPAETAEAAPAAEAAAPAEAPAAAAEPVAANGETLYNQICFACHNTGAAGAPKLGDKAAWEPRIATGMDTLLNSAINGKNAMPAKGGNPGLSDDAIQSIVEYMVGKAQ